MTGTSPDLDGEEWVERCPECGRTWDHVRDDRECWSCEVPTIEKGQDKITEWSA